MNEGASDAPHAVKVCNVDRLDTDLEHELGVQLHKVSHKAVKEVYSSVYTIAKVRINTSYCTDSDRRYRGHKMWQRISWSL